MTQFWRVSYHPKWIVFIICAIAVFMVDVDVTAINLTLPQMAADLRFQLSAAQWIIDGYMIAASALMVLGGHLCDRLGYKNVFLGGLFAFGLASAGVALSHGVYSITLARLLQGACVAFTFPISLVVVRSAFPEHQHGFVLGLMIAIAGLSQAIGPTFGSFIITYFDWRTIFWFNVPLVVLCLIVGYVVIEKPLQSPAVVMRSYASYGLYALYCLSMIMLMCSLNLRWLGVFGIAILTMMCFVYFEARSKSPLLDFSLFRSYHFCLANIIRFSLSFIYFGLLFTVCLMLQNILHYTILEAGSVILVLTMLLGVLSIPAGKLIDKIGTCRPLMIGAILLLPGVMLLAAFGFFQSILFLFAAFLVLGVSFALLVPASAACVFTSVKPEQSGIALGLFFTTSFLGGSVGVAVSGLLLHYFSALKMQMIWSTIRSSLTAEQAHAVLTAAAGVQNVSAYHGLLGDRIMALAGPLVQSAFTDAFLWVTGLFFLFSVIVFFSAWRYRKVM